MMQADKEMVDGVVIVQVPEILTPIPLERRQHSSRIVSHRKQSNSNPSPREEGVKRYLRLGPSPLLPRHEQASQLSQREAKTRVVIAAVPLVLGVAAGREGAVFGGTAVATAVLAGHAGAHGGGGGSAEPHHGEGDGVAGAVGGGVGLDEDVGGDDAGHVADRDLQARAERALPVTRQVVGEPGERQRCRRVAAQRDEEEGRELGVAPVGPPLLVVVGVLLVMRWWLLRLAEQHPVSDRRHNAPQQDEAVPVPQPVREPGHEQHAHRRDRVHRDRADLRLLGPPPELEQDGRHEEGRRVACHAHAHVRERPEPDFGVREDEAEGMLVKGTRMIC